jgi:transposase-like protein
MSVVQMNGGPERSPCQQFSREKGAPATRFGISQGTTQKPGVVMIDHLPPLTDAIQEAICFCLRCGTSRKSAARLVGVSSQTWRRWMSCAKHGTEPYVEFRKAVWAAETSVEIKMVRILFQEATDNVAYARWWLEHRHPARWSNSGRRLARLAGRKSG